MMLSTLLVAAGLAAAPAPADSLISADSAMVLLKQGGYTMMWRHAQTDRSIADVPGQNTERYQQRNLTDVGVNLAKSVGAIFRARGIPMGEVVASPMYRTMETAQYAFGKTTPSPLLRTIDPSAEERAMLLVEPASGTNRVLVTHHFIIERNAPGIKPGDVNEGEAAIVKSDGKSLKTIAVIKNADWARLAASAVTVQAPASSHAAATFAVGSVSAETAAMIHTARGMVALSYVQSFNAGRDAMKAFFENYAVPNPARTIEQRLEAYDKIRTDIGWLATVTGAEVVGADGLNVKATTTTGKAVTITFKQEVDKPFRAISINVQYAGSHGG